MTDAVRDGRRKLFHWPMHDVAAAPLLHVEQPPVPDDAQLITWQPDHRPPVPVRRLCGTAAG